MIKQDVKNATIPVLNVGKAVDFISDLLVRSIRTGSAKDIPSFMLWGKPGVGKSQGVKQIADKVSRMTGKKSVVCDVRLLLFNPIDLRGIPVADATKTFAIWLKPKIFDMDPGDSVINFLFLDEISSAPPSVQAAAYQITLDRVVGEHKLPDNCIVIAAGNRIVDRSVAYKMPKALANRLCHFEIDVDSKSWLTWASANGVDNRVISFIRVRSDLLCSFDPSKDDVAFATPRSWDQVSKILLKGYSNTRDAYPFIAGLVGEGIACEFCSWCELNMKIPDLEQIKNGTCTLIPNSADALYATIQLMMSYLSKNLTDKTSLDNCLTYSCGFPPDYTAVFFKKLVQISEQAKVILLSRPAFSNWVRRHASLFK